MTFLGIIFFVFAFIIAFELFVHIIYFWKTGKGGLYDPPFEYLKDIFKGDFDSADENTAR